MAQIQDPTTAAGATVDATTLCLSTEEKQASTLFIGATATAATATATLPAAGAGLFHYITSIDVHHVATAAIVGSAVVAVSTTNLPGTMAWTCGNASPVGQKVQDVLCVPAKPIKSSVANTATTVVAASFGATAVAKINVHYFTAK